MSITKLFSILKNGRKRLNAFMDSLSEGLQHWFVKTGVVSLMDHKLEEMTENMSRKKRGYPIYVPLVVFPHVHHFHSLDAFLAYANAAHYQHILISRAFSGPNYRMGKSGHCWLPPGLLLLFYLSLTKILFLKKIRFFYIQKLMYFFFLFHG